MTKPDQKLVKSRSSKPATKSAQEIRNEFVSVMQKSGFSRPEKTGGNQILLNSRDKIALSYRTISSQQYFWEAPTRNALNYLSALSHHNIFIVFLRSSGSTGVAWKLNPDSITLLIKRQSTKKNKTKFKLHDHQKERKDYKIKQKLDFTSINELSKFLDVTLTSATSQKGSQEDGVSLEGRKVLRQHKKIERSSMARKKFWDNREDFVTCDACGVRWGSVLYDQDLPLDAHHLLPLGISGEIAADPKNFSALCPNCHRSAHQNIANIVELKGKDYCGDIENARKEHKRFLNAVKRKRPKVKFEI